MLGWRRACYDALGRLVGVTDVYGNAAEYSYDALGNITGISRFTAAQVSIIQFTPGRGPVGTSVTIYGTGFSSTKTQDVVKFSGVTATISSATNTRGNILDIFHGRFERDGFKARLFDVQGMGHNICDNEALSSALDFLETGS
jgi:YD repeat-containing protein